MDLILVNLIDGLVTGLLLFMLSAGLTLIFSMMGVLNFAHASFYMLGAYFAYQISLALGFWMGLLIAPLVVGVMGAGVERYGLRRVHQYGHVPELIFTFGLALLIEELVQFIWGKNQLPYAIPDALNFTAFAISGNSIPAYKIFMIFISLCTSPVVFFCAICTFRLHFPCMKSPTFIILKRFQQSSQFSSSSSFTVKRFSLKFICLKSIFIFVIKESVCEI